MTREEFYNRVTSWGDLLDVAEEYDLADEFENIVGQEYVRERIQIRAGDIDYGDDWENFASWVSSIPCGYEYWSYDSDYDEFSGLNNGDFDSHREDLLTMMLDYDYIEEDTDEAEPDGEEYIPYNDEDYEDEPEEDDDGPEPEEAFPVDKLISMCYAEVKVIRDNRQAEEQSAQQEFDAKLTQMLR